MTCGCGMGGGMWGWLMGPLGLVAMVALWALLIWGGVVLVRHLSVGSASGAERVLSRRFAAGEIDEDEYRERLQALTPASEESAPWPFGRSR